MFDLQAGKIKLNIDDLGVPPFREYYNTAKDKSYALKEIEYVVWLHKWDSPYEAYPTDKRASVVAKDVFKDENYIPSDAVKELELRFKEF